MVDGRASSTSRGAAGQEVDVTADPVVVGYDGSAAAGRAAGWAAEEAQRCGGHLVVVTAAGVPGVVPPSATVGPWVSAQALDAARWLVQEGFRVAHRSVPDLPVDSSALTGAAGPALVHASRRGARLVVVGARGQGAAAAHDGAAELSGSAVDRRREAALGSVAAAVAAHASCSVVVVRDVAPPSPGPGSPVLVGVDGSRASVEAVRFAADAAWSRGCSLVVACAWSTTPVDTWPRTPRPGDDCDPTPEAAVERLAVAAVRAAAGEALVRHPHLPVSQRVVHGTAARALLAEADGECANLLVVGARGLGGFQGLLLGSVSTAVAGSCPCPVVLVRGAQAHAHEQPRPRSAAPAK